MKKYPRVLLPLKHFKKIVDIGKIRNGYLIHYTDTKDNRDANKKLKTECITRRTDHLRDYSNNLLGVFETSNIYIYINPKIKNGYFTQSWKVGTKVDSPTFPDEYNYKEERGYFYLEISKMHNSTFKYTDDSNTLAKCVVLHTPTNSNFWHISLRWFCNDQDVINWNEKQRRRILTAAKTLIKENAKFDEPFYSEWDQSIYS